MNNKKRRINRVTITFAHPQIDPAVVQTPLLLLSDNLTDLSKRISLTSNKLFEPQDANLLFIFIFGVIYINTL